MGETVKKLNPFKKFEFEYLESYLEEKAAGGLILVEAGRWFLTFEKAEPKEMKYRMIPKDAWEDKEKLDGFEEKGWKAVGGDYLPLLANEDPDADELFWDAGSFADRKGHVPADLKIYYFGLICGTVMMIVTTIQSILDGGLLHDIELNGWFEYSARIVLIVYLIVFAAVLIVRSKKVYARIKRGGPLRHDLDGRRRGISNIIAEGILAVLFILWFISVAVFLIEDDVKEMTWKQELAGTKTQMARAAYQHPVCVRTFDNRMLKDMENEIKLFEKDQSAVKKADEGEVSLPSYARKDETTFLFYVKKYECASMGSSGSDKEYGFYEATYYEAKTEWIASRYLEEEIRSDAEWPFDDSSGEKSNGSFGSSPEKAVSTIGFDVPGADYAGYAEDKDGYGYLYIRKGKKAEIVSYRGNRDLKGSAQLFLKDLTDD